jgi:hypothetical protein
MPSLRTTALLVCIVAFTASGCGSSAGPGGGGNPTPTPSPTLGPGQHFYTTDGANPGRIYVFNLPLNAASAPVVVVQTTGNGIYNPCFDGAGHIFVTYRNTARVDVYNLPLSSASTPAYSLTLPGNSVDCHFDGAGNLYVALPDSNELAVFKAPVTSASTLNSVITTGVHGPWGVFADAGGNVYASNLTNQTIYNSLASGNTLQATFGTQNDNYGIIIGPDAHLYVSNVLGTNEIDVYNPPFINGSTADSSKTIHVQTVTPTHCITYISFDSSGNLYITGSDDNDATFNHIYVYAPPYTTQTLNVSLGAIKLRGDQVGP